MLVAQYGERVLALPKNDGFNLAVYVVPVIVAVARRSRCWRSPSRAGDERLAHAPSPRLPRTPVISDEDTRRLDEDLARRD